MATVKRKRRYRLNRVPRKRIMEAISTHQSIARGHPHYSETYRYSMQSIAALRAELARRDTRKHNPRTRSLKWDRCVTDVTIKGTAASPSAVCTSALAHKGARRRRNRLKRSTPGRTVALYVRRRGKTTLKYLGRGKFGVKGRAFLFASLAQALGAGRALRDAFPSALRGYIFHAK